VHLRSISLLLVLSLLLAACGSSDSDSTTSTSASTTAATCPTSNTKSFAKTRFAADLGGAFFLSRRYLYQPYRAGKFKKGASGRTFAIIKGTAAAAASVKLLKNARDNAQANPTLCKTIARPLSALIDQLGGIGGALRSGNLGGLAGLGAGLAGLGALAGKAGVPVTEQPTKLG
jgi:hypothetical protein